MASDGAESSIMDTLRMLVEHRRKTEKELAEELRKRREQMTEEREHREKETEERMRMMQQQMEALQKLVAESRKREEKSEMEQLKLTKLADQYDIEAFLTTFKRMMGVFGIEQNRWASNLAPQLTGKAQKTFAAMQNAEASDYDQLKKAILKCYNISGETCRQRLRMSDESNQEMVSRVMELVQKWMADLKQCKRYWRWLEQNSC